MRYAALLHDIGHMPFSHGPKDSVVFPDGVNHEIVSAYLIENCEEMATVMEKDGVFPKTVASMIAGEYFSRFEVLKKIISGEFDADRADYLLRDSYFCGVSYGNYDYDRYAMAFKLFQKDNGTITLAVEEGNVSVLESFLIARFHYNMQVPFHRTRVGYDFALSQYMRTLIEANRIQNVFPNGTLESMDIGAFCDFDDYSVFSQAKVDDKNGDKWAPYLFRKRHLKPLYDRNVAGKHNSEDVVNFKDIVFALMESGLKHKEDFYRYDKQLEIHKIIRGSNEQNDGLVADGDGGQTAKMSNVEVVDRNNERIGDIVQCSAIIGKFAESPIRILRIYVTQENFDRAWLIYEKVMERIKGRNACTEN